MTRYLILTLLVGSLAFVSPQTDGPILVTMPGNSFRPVALNASSFTEEPFTLLTDTNLSSDKQTRLLLFGRNITNTTRVLMRDRQGVETSAVIEHREHLTDGVTQLIVLIPSVLNGPLTVWFEDRGLESKRGVIAFKSATESQKVNLIFAGNSLTAGYDTQNLLPVEQNYPSRTCAELERQGYHLQCHNKGIGGQTTTEMLQRAADIDSLIQGPSVVVVWELGNDLMFTTSSEEQLFDHLATYCRERRQLGAKVVVMTVPYRRDIASDPVKSAMLERLNQRIRNEHTKFADVLVDLTLDLRLPNLMQPDKVHFLPEGYAAIAEDVVTDIRAIL